MLEKMSFRGNKMTYKVLFSAILLLAILAASISFSACSNNPESSSPGYILETLSKRDINFSYEYPVGYEPSDPNPYERTDIEMEVVGERYLALYTENKTSKQINIQLWNPTVDLPDAKSRLDYYAANIQNAGENPEISERSPLRVAGVDGEKLVFTYTMENVTDMPSRIYCWVAAFDSKGQIWFIIMATNIEAPDEAKADFEHLINTFKILD
jgi:hypothetical protein